MLFAAVAPVQAQHPGGRWHTIETAHFRVHVRPDLRDLGVRAAGEAEAAYTALAALLPAPRTRVELVVSDDIDAANGYATPFAVPTVVVFASPPAGDVELGTYDRWLRLVITHELAHIFHLDLARGWWGAGRRVFGRVPGLFPNLYTPTWFIEGSAVFFESRLTGGGRLDAAFHRAVVTAAFTEGHGMPVDAANGLSPRWPGGIRPYGFGGTFIGALAAQRGDSVVPQVMLRIAKRPLPYLQFSGALRQAAGRSFRQAWREWADGRTGGRAEELAGGQAGRRAEENVLVAGLRTVVVPRVSADGRRVLFVQSDGRDEPRVAVWDRDARAVRLLARVNSEGGVTWDGDAALVAQLEFTNPWVLRSDLWRLAATGGERQITHAARLREPDAGPGGVVVAVRAVPGGNELVLLESGTTRMLVAAVSGTEWSHPRWSPDGALIAVARTRAGVRDIVLLSAEGALVREVTHDRTPDGMPVFTPDGALLLWTRDLDGGPQIVGQRLADGAMLRFSDAPFAAYAPAPATDSLYYLSYHHDGFRLVAVPLEGVSWTPPPADGTVPDTLTPPAVIVAEHGYRAFPAARPHWALPSLVSVVGGTFVGAQSSGADALGRHAWFADAGVGLGSGAMRGRWRYDLVYRYAGFAPAVIDADVSRDWFDYLVASAGADSLRCCLQEDGADLGVTVRRRRFRSQQGARLGAEYDRDAWAERVGVVASVSASRLEAPAQSISLQKGWLLAATVRRRWRQEVPLAYSQLTLTGAAYAPGRMLGFARQVFVARGAVGVITGTDPVRLGVGGVSSGTFEALPGVTVGGSSRTFPVRGYPGAFLAGRSVASLALEVRAPLAMVGRGPGLFPVTLDRVSMALFADGGVAWHSGACAQTAAGVGGAAGECPEGIASLGGEMVVDAGMLWVVPVRLRLGTAWRLTLRSGAAYAAVGASF